MKAIILAAGRGSRLGHLTDNVPKSLMAFRGKQMLEIQLEVLKSAGINEIGIVRGYKKECIQYDGIEYFDNDNWANTNMVQSLLKAEQWLENDTCLICYSDILYTDTLIKLLMEENNMITVPYNLKWKELWELRFDNPLEDAESFKLDNQNNIKEIGEKVSDISQIEGQFMGLVKTTPLGYKMLKDILKKQEEVEQLKMDMTTLLRLSIESGVKIKGVPSDTFWIEVDSEKDLLLYQSL